MLHSISPEIFIYLIIDPVLRVFSQLTSLLPILSKQAILNEDETEKINGPMSWADFFCHQGPSYLSAKSYKLIKFYIRFFCKTPTIPFISGRDNGFLVKFDWLVLIGLTRLPALVSQEPFTNVAAVS